MDSIKSWIDRVDTLDYFRRRVYLVDPEPTTFICILGAQTRWNFKKNPTTFDEWLCAANNRLHIEKVLETLRIDPRTNLLRFLWEKHSLELSQYNLVQLILLAKDKYQEYRNSEDAARIIDRKLDTMRRWVECKICGRFIHTDEVGDHQEFDCYPVVRCMHCRSYEVEHKNITHPLCNACLEDLEM